MARFRASSHGEYCSSFHIHRMWRTLKVVSLIVTGEPDGLRNAKLRRRHTAKGQRAQTDNTHIIAYPTIQLQLYLHNQYLGSLTHI